MNHFKIDPKKCKRDGICVAVCPFSLLEMPSKKAVPVPVPYAEERCIKCGHCVAVCPHGALTLKTMSPEDCAPLREDLKPNREQVEHLLRARRSIRVYKKKTVSQKTLKEVIRLAGYAPSGHNVQLTQWLVIEKAGEIRHLAAVVIEWMRSVLEKEPEFGRRLDLDLIVAAWERGEDSIFRGAPTLIIAHAPQDFSAFHAVRAQFTIAMTYLELAASSFGLGACWAGYFQAAVQLYPPMNEAIGLPKGHLSYESMMLGYPKFPYYRMPLRNPPRISWR